MKLFIDSANYGEIRNALDTGMLDGVTTNPTLVAKEGHTQAGITPDRIVQNICELVDPLPVSVEVGATASASMVREAKELAGLAGNLVVKLPTTEDGIKALGLLDVASMKTNMTLIFQPLQAMIVGKLGATYCSPFLGRLDDIGQDSMEFLADIRRIYDNYAFDTKILAASLRHPMHVLQAARIGADAATMPFAVFSKLLGHPLTDAGLERFMADAAAAKTGG